jgi:hypothetical protein
MSRQYRMQMQKKTRRNTSIAKGVQFYCTAQADNETWSKDWFVKIHFK